MRNGLLVMGTILLLSGAIISVLSGTMSVPHLATSDFRASRNQWYFSDPISLPPGVTSSAMEPTREITVTLSWNSNQDVTIGLTDVNKVKAFQGGMINTPLFPQQAHTGRVGSFSVTLNQGDDYFVCIQVALSTGTWSMSVDITMPTPFAYAALGVPILVVGIVLLVLGAALKAKPSVRLAG